MLVVTHTNICSSKSSTASRECGFTAVGTFSYRSRISDTGTRIFGTMLSPGTFLAALTVE